MKIQRLSPDDALRPHAVIAYTPLGNRLFGTAPLLVGPWLFVLPFAMGMFALEELRKWVQRRLSPWSPSS